MKRGVIDTLRRGFDNAVANWQLTLVRFGEACFYGVLVVVSVIAILVPIFISIGIEFSRINTPDDIEGAVYRLVERWPILIWIFVGIMVLMLVIVAVHSFVEAGCARVLVDGDRLAGPVTQGPRSRYAVFSMERWFAGAREGWWALFWIYNAAWGVAGLILLIPLLPTLALMLVFREEPAAAVTTGCIGLALTVMLMIAVSIVTGIWTNRAIADWAVRRRGVRDALRGAWHAFKTDLGRHLLIALALVAISFAAGGFIGSISIYAAFAERIGEGAWFFTIPVRLFTTLVNWVLSAFVANWFLAAFAALAVETPTE